MSEGPKTMTPADMASEKKVQWKYLDNQLQAAVRQVDTKLNNDIAIMKAKAEVYFQRKFLPGSSTVLQIQIRICLSFYRYR